MSTQTSVAGFLANFALLKIAPTRLACPILGLPYDIFLDSIFPTLHVEDIICLRRVNKLFYILTHEPVIWKRFLREMKLPLPPLRPTYRFSLGKNDFEPEQLVTRAISLDDNWRNHHTAVRKHKILASDRVTLEMKLLPGGKYLISSETDERNYRYSMTIYALDHPNGFLPLARTDTGQRAFHIQAKYLKHKGQQGIVITCTRRKFRKASPPWLNASFFSPDAEIDATVPFDYELLCYHVNLETLEMVSDPDIRPRTQQFYDQMARLGPPFRLIAYLGSRSRIEHSTLFEYNQEPFIAFVQQPDRIHIKNLNSGSRSILQCRPLDVHHEQFHRINCIRALPGQRDIFVIRSVKTADPTAPINLIELFEMPLNGEKMLSHPREQQQLSEKPMSHFFVSEYIAPSLSPDHPKLRPFDGPPPPISVFIQTINPNSITHYKLWPEPICQPATHSHALKTTYRYTTRFFTDQSVRLTDSHAAFVLPGTDRAIMYHVPEDDRTDSPPMLNLRKYIDPGYRPVDLPDNPDDDTGDILRNARLKVPHKVFSTVKMPKIWTNKLSQGISAITWDEGIGRVCISAKNDKVIRVLDFAHCTALDTRYASWMRLQRSA